VLGKGTVITQTGNVLKQRKIKEKKRKNLGRPTGGVGSDSPCFRAARGGGSRPQGWPKNNSRFQGTRREGGRQLSDRGLEEKGCKRKLGTWKKKLKENERGERGLEVHKRDPSKTKRRVVVLEKED